MTASERQNVFLESRYRKFVRDLPQTIFWCPSCDRRSPESADCPVCGGRGRLGDDSVQELVARRLLPAYRARFGRFHGAGREDIDVRMLGRGRPFVFELVRARPGAVDLEAVVARINEQGAGRIEIDLLRPVARTRVRELKEGEFRKRYRVGVSVDLASADVAAVTARLGSAVVIEQRTPERVAHRRGDHVRVREVVPLAVTIEPSEGAALVLDIETEHGTYVKEWVSGDGGRSTPSLASWLGVPAQCAWLDVTEILDA